MTCFGQWNTTKVMAWQFVPRSQEVSRSSFLGHLPPEPHQQAWASLLGDKRLHGMETIHCSWNPSASSVPKWDESSLSEMGRAYPAEHSPDCQPSACHQQQLTISFKSSCIFLLGVQERNTPATVPVRSFSQLYLQWANSQDKVTFPSGTKSQCCLICGKRSTNGLRSS